MNPPSSASAAAAAASASARTSGPSPGSGSAPAILISVGRTIPTRYLDAVQRAGGIPAAKYLPSPDASFDALILAGGGDMLPERYGAIDCGSTNLDPERDKAELELLDAFAAWGKPILGICRGLQVLNVWAGGTLVQDLGSLVSSHQQLLGDAHHLIHTVPNTILSSLYGEHAMVNSSHHQAADRLGLHLTPTAFAPDGTLEALEHTTLPIFAVQFHPERMNSPKLAPGTPVFSHLIHLCRKN